MTNNGSCLSRRTVMVSVGCAPAVMRIIINQEPPSPDAKLIDLGEKFEQLTTIWDEMACRTNHTYENFDIQGLIERLNPIESAIVAIPAKTIEGLAVKARAANWSCEGRIYPEHEASTDKKMAWSIVRDLLELTAKYGGAKVTTSASTGV